MNTLRIIMLTMMLAAASQAAADGFAGDYLGLGLNRTGSATSPYPASAENTPPGLGAGFGWNLGNSVLFGVEGFVDMAPDAAHAPLAQLYGSHTYGLGLKIGVPLDSIMPYARLGYDHTYGSGAFSGISASAANGGLGLLYMFSPSWSLGGELSSTIPATGGLKLKSNSVSVGLHYRFGASGSAVSYRK